MQVTETLSQGLKREFKVVLPAQDLAVRLDTQLGDMQQKARIKGFRPGKVPVAHLKRLYGRSIMAEVMQEAVNEANRKIVADNDLRLATEPKLDLPSDKDEVEKAFEAKTDFTFSLALEVMPKFEIGAFDDIEIEKLVTPVSDDDINDVLNRLANEARTFTPKTAEDAVAETGDKVTIDFLGKIGEAAFEGGTGTDMDVVLGSGTFIPGFEDQLLGSTVGENRVLNVTFPENYASATLAGQAATFDVTTKAIAAPEPLAIDDAFAKTYGLDDLEKFKDSIRSRIESDYVAAARNKWKRQLLDALDKKYTFDLPEGLVAQEFESVWAAAKTEQDSSGKSFEDAGTTEEAARADYRRIAERRVRLGLVLAEIGEKAEVKVPDEEMGKALMEMARAYPGREKEVWDYYTKDRDALASIRAPLYEEKVIDHIMAQAKVTEKSVSKEELMKPLPDDELPGQGEPAASATAEP